jgi:GNAT superfamily N-acetyltransferase
VIIRTARPGDQAGLALVHIESWRTTYRGLVPDEFLAKLSLEARERRWTRMLDTAQSDGHLILVAENEAGQIVGFADGGRQREADLPYKGELYAIYLLQEAQGRGLGRLLMQTLARRLEEAGFEDLLLWVVTANPSCGFYERMGGQPIAAKPVEIGGLPLEETAYGWPDIRVLTR